MGFILCDKEFKKSSNILMYPVYVGMVGFRNIMWWRIVRNATTVSALQQYVSKKEDQSTYDPGRKCVPFPRGERILCEKCKSVSELQQRILSSDWENKVTKISI